MTEVRLGAKVRTLTAEDLKVGFTAAATEGGSGRAASAPDAPSVDPNDERVRDVIDLLGRYSGVILSGPPGTSKTYLARAVAQVLTSGDDSRQALTQFHPSYQYEDFIEGYRPKDDGGFVRRSGVFMQLCEEAARSADPNAKYVIVIDELSRGDAARVFGEALTYIERTKRGMEFWLPSGRKAFVPPNVAIIATMNPLDRGVDEVDAAFERRFAKKIMAPDSEMLDARLRENGLDDTLRDGVVGWFKDLNGQDEAAQMGQAYFWDVTDAFSLRDVWEHQIQHHVKRAFRFNEAARDRLTSRWEAMFGEPASDG